MKRLLTILLCVLLTANFLSCGGGGVGSGSSTDTTGKTKVTINLGETKAVSKAGGLKSTSAIPAAIASIKFTISAPDMATIVRVVTIAGRSGISETFEVPSGANRHFVAEALDAIGNVLFKGDIYADLTGTSADLTIVMVSVEDIAPVFSGLSNIGTVTTTSMVLSWSAATDNVTPPEKIQYLIYVSTTPGGQDFSNPNFVTIPGATTFGLTGLHPNTTYYIVVRAKDERGNIDGNTVEKSATTFEGILTATALSPTQIKLSWNPVSGTDVVYLIYMATSSHGENLAIPTFTITGSTSFTVTGLNPGTTYYFIVRVKDGAGNIDSNTVEKAATTSTLLADLSPTNVGYDPLNQILSGFRINNFGNVSANSVVYAVWTKDYIGNTFCSAGGTVPSIAAGSFTDISLGSIFGVTDYYIVIDPFATVPESNRGNNSACSGSFCISPPTPSEIFSACFG